MFRGLSAVSIDAKGRMAIPARYKGQLAKKKGGILVITIDTEQHCLLMYPYEQWEVIEEKLESLSSFNPATRRIQRLLIGHATEVEIDRNGRVLLPALLRDYAGIDKTAMLVGQGKKFEVWSEEKWQTARDAWLSEGSDEQSMPPELQGLSL